MKSLNRVLILLLVIVLAIPAIAGSVSVSPKPRVKTLTDAAATGYVDISIQSNQVVSGMVRWSIDATDGTAYQTRAGATYFTAVNEAGTVACAVGDIGTTIESTPTGTLTNTMTCTAGTLKFTLNANADSSLTGPTIKIKYFVDIIGPSTATGK